jgi:hypothetical protein
MCNIFEIIKILTETFVQDLLGRVKGIGDFWTPHLDAFYPIFGQHEPSIYENPLTPALAPIFLLLPSSFNRGME